MTGRIALMSESTVFNKTRSRFWVRINVNEDGSYNVYSSDSVLGVIRHHQSGIMHGYQLDHAIMGACLKAMPCTWCLKVSTLEPNVTVDFYKDVGQVLVQVEGLEGKSLEELFVFFQARRAAHLKNLAGRRAFISANMDQLDCCPAVDTWTALHQPPYLAWMCRTVDRSKRFELLDLARTLKKRGFDMNPMRHEWVYLYDDRVGRHIQLKHGGEIVGMMAVGEVAELTEEQREVIRAVAVLLKREWRDREAKGMEPGRDREIGRPNLIDVV